MQNNLMIPLFQYPITTLWVDDDHNFLDTIDYTLQGKNNKFFSNAADCINFLSTYINPRSQMDFLYPESDNENYWLDSHSPVDLNVLDICKLRDIDKKDQEVGVLVCDYRMPTVSGIELCKRLKEFSFKKILLTGEMQDTDAVPVFNDDTINRFIKKDDPNLIEEVDKFVKVLSRQYFCEITAPFLAHLEADQPSPLSDKFFIYFFDKWCEENKIQEFYLIDKNGSFLAVDDTGKQKFFILHTDQSLDVFVELYAEVSQVSSLLNEVKSRNRVPFFGCGIDPCKVDLALWEKHFYKTQVVDGRKRYYIANITS